MASVHMKETLGEQQHGFAAVTSGYCGGSGIICPVELSL